jgi:hypothetical protein
MIDRYGYCVKCGKYMISEAVIDGVSVQRFTPDYSEKQYLLSDGSKMRVAICIACKDAITDEDKKPIMQTVMNGWKAELDKLDWTKEKKQNYVDNYSKLEIVHHTDNTPSDILDIKFKEYKEKKNGDSK